VAVARQRRGKHVSVATNKYAIMEEFLEAVFYMVHAEVILCGHQWSREFSMKSKSAVEKLYC
jgi:hypothetical protein